VAEVLGAFRDKLHFELGKAEAASPQPDAFRTGSASRFTRGLRRIIMQAGKIVDGIAYIAQNFDSELAEFAHYESVMLTHDECGRLGALRML
jgi:hypothetical protein